MKNIRSILLLGTENILALSVIRSLGNELPDAHIHTYSPCSSENKVKSVAERSKYVHSNHYFSEWDDPLLHFKLIKLINDIKADVILPVSALAVKKLSAIKDSLKNFIHLPPLPDPEIVEQLEDKYRLSEVLRKYDMPQARTWFLKSNIIPVLKKDDFPLLIKPKVGSSGIGIQELKSEEELLNFIKKSDDNSFIIQEILSGYEVGCSVLAVDGEVKAHTIQKVIGNKGYGVATALKFIEDEQVLEQTKKIIKATNYSGLAHLDFRMDHRDNQPKLLDFNARFWHSLRGSKAAGIDFAYLYCLSAYQIFIENTGYKNITYFLGSNTLQYYWKKMFNFRRPYEATKSVYTDLWDRLGDPLPEFARYMR